MYLQYFDGDINEFLYEMEQYINQWVYGTVFCDIVPFIMANVLKIPIIIIDKTYTFYQVFVNYPPDEKYCINASFLNSDLSNFIVLCIFKYHYDAYVKLKSSVSYPNENILSDKNIYRDEETDKLSDISVFFCLHDNLHANACFINDGDDVHACSDMLNESCNDYLYHMKGYRIKNARNCIIGHLNVNSIRNKFDAIECILSEGLADIFAISESKLDDSFSLSQLSVTDFSIHRKDRNRHGGGVLIYVRSDIPHRRRLDLEPEPQKSYDDEVLVIETRPYKADKWFIVVFYKPPNVKDKHFATVFSELCQALQRESSHWFVMGDTNFDMKTDNLLCDLCVTYNLKNLVGGPTCFKGENPTAVDVLLSSEPISVLKVH